MTDLGNIARAHAWPTKDGQQQRELSARKSSLGKLQREQNSSLSSVSSLESLRNGASGFKRHPRPSHLAPISNSTVRPPPQQQQNKVSTRNSEQPLVVSSDQGKVKRPPGPFRWISRRQSHKNRVADSDSGTDAATYSDRERRLISFAQEKQDPATQSADESSSAWSDGSDRPRLPSGSRGLRHATKSFLRRFQASKTGPQDINAIASNYLTPTTPKASANQFFQFDSKDRPPDALPAEELLAQHRAGQSSVKSGPPDVPDKSLHRQINDQPSTSIASIKSPYTNISGRTRPTSGSPRRSLSSSEVKSLHRTQSQPDLKEEPEPPQGSTSPDPFPRSALSKGLAREQVSQSRRPETRSTRSEADILNDPSHLRSPTLSDTASKSTTSPAPSASTRSFDALRSTFDQTTPSSISIEEDADMVQGAEKGSSGWRSRFSPAQRRNNGEASTETNLIDRFRLDKRSNSSSIRTPRAQRDATDGADKESYFNGSGRQKAANGSRGLNALSTMAHTQLYPIEPAHRPFQSTGSLIGRSKAERMTGESASEFGIPSDNVGRANSISKTAADISSHTISGAGEDDQACPVCLELLSFRLIGEKPHVVPTCGHALHHACFTAVYGSPEAVLAAQSAPGRAQPPGMCGVCRRLIVLGEGPKSRRPSKLAGIMGMDAEEGSAVSQDEHGMVSGDDPLEGSSSLRKGQVRNLASSQYGAYIDDSASVMTARGMIIPRVRARPEYTTVYRKDRDEEQSGRQNVVCVISIDVPCRRRIAEMEEDEDFWQQKLESIRPKLTSEDEKDEEADDDVKESALNGHDTNHANGTAQAVNEQARNGSSEEENDDEAFSFGATPAKTENTGPFASAIEDLRVRILDWKGHSVDRFGSLELHDFLGVRQDNVVREFFVYLFEEALLCVAEERKREKGLSRLINSGGSNGEESSDPKTPGSTRGSKAALKLKGRIWLRHIRKCESIEQEGSPCLSIKLDDEGLDHFVLCFKDDPMRQQWQQNINNLLERKAASKGQEQNGNASNPATPVNDKGKHGGKTPLSPVTDNDASSRKRQASSATNVPSINSGKSGSMTAASSPVASMSSRNFHTMSATKGKDSQPKFIAGLPQHQQWSASGGLDPLAPAPDLQPHTPVDLVIMISVPSIASQPAVSSATVSSSAALKLRLIRSTLDFVISHLGPRDRIALVSYNVGHEGLVRRTALLNSSKDKSREKLEQFVETIGKPWEGPGEDPFREDIDRLAGNGDRTDTVTAVNVGFDIVLQRKSKNPITSMFLINDTADAPRRGQMDLVMARAEAANVPVHCFGFGKSHDPSSLWLISNHTRGSYTFVKEWYQLRECVAGCIGSVLSVGLTDVKLHISVPSDNHFRVRKVAGPSGAVVSASGKDVDIDLGELRFGERKELFVELELDFAALVVQHSLNNRRKPIQDHYEKGSATDDFMQRLGLSGLSIAEYSSRNEREDQAKGDVDFVDELAVLEVQCGCRDPSMGTSANRLPDPCVMTIEVDSTSKDPAAEASGASGLATAMADPVVTRRRLEILVSDMITRSLLLVSRRNHHQALTILVETRRIVDTVLQAIPLRETEEAREQANGSIRREPHQGAGKHGRSSQAKRQRELLHRKTALSLLGILDDLDVLIDGLESGKSSSFERTERNFGAQQAMVLRDQKAWTSRTDTEWQFFRSIDNGPSFAALAASYAAFAPR